MIEQEKIDRIKATVDMVALAEARGIKLKKNGRGYFGLCPFHDDKNPSLSINPKTNLWQCFGCGAAGGVIRFIELFDRVDFTEAVRILSANEMTAPRKSPTRKPPPQPQPKDNPQSQIVKLTVKQKKLLARVIAYYQHTLEETTQGLDYLKNKRGISRNQSLKDFGAGYVNGTLLSILPDDDQIINDLKTISILNAKGNERFLNCVVFPLYDAAGAVVNPYTPYLSYPTKSLISRRDHDKDLGLIEAIAFLHQYQRQTRTVQVDGKALEYIEVTLDDIDKANTLANDVLGQSLDELARPSRICLTASIAWSRTYQKDRSFRLMRSFLPGGRSENQSTGRTGRSAPTSANWKTSNISMSALGLAARSMPML